MQRPRVGFLVSSDTFGGAEFYVEQLLTRLPRDLEAVVVTAGELPDRLGKAALAAGAEVVAVGSVGGKLDVFGQWRLHRTLRRARLDVAHVNATMSTNNRWELAAAIAGGVPVVVTLHLRHAVTSRTQRALLRLAYCRVAAAIAVSAEVASQLEHELAVPTTRLHLIANGVDVRDPPMTSAAEGRAVRIGAVGRLEAQKGFDLLLEAIRRLVAAGREVELVLGGEGPEEAALRAAARCLPVRFAGPVDVAQFVAGVDVFCLPSRWEGLPFVLLEAMMSGRPAVVTDVGDVAAAVGDTAVVVPPASAGALAEALDRLVGDPGERRRLGAAAAERARRRFSSERMLDDTVAIYRDILAR